jgi:hypothetical protein
LLLAGHLGATGALRLCFLALTMKMMTLGMHLQALLTQQQVKLWEVGLMRWQVVLAAAAAAAAGR